MIFFITLLVSLLLLYVFGLMYLRQGLNRLSYPRQFENFPFVSIVISAHNEEKNLPDCLRLLAEQSYPEHQIEFIMVNDRSNDKTQHLIENMILQDSRFRILTISDRLPEIAPKKRAIDSALKIAQGEIILLTDADGRPGRNWVKNMISYFSEDTDMVIGYAPYQVKPEGHFIKKILSLEYLSHAVIAAASAGLGYPLTCVGTNMAYRKKLYEEAGGFAEFRAHLSGDDDLFLTRIREQKKYKIRYATAAETHVYNNPPQLWSKFFHQRMRYASKGFDYPFKVTAVLVLFFMFNLTLFLGLISWWNHTNLFFSAMIGLIIKSIFEFSFIRKGAKVLNDTRFLSFFPITALIHIPYVIIFASLGQLKLFRWKGANAEAAVQRKVFEEVA